LGWDVVTALATTGAVLVALGGLLLPVWLRYWRRPRLQWSVSTVEVHRLSQLQWKAGGPDSDLRIHVENPTERRRGRPAENVRAVLDAVWVATPGEERPWGVLPIDVTPLGWAIRRSSSEESQWTTVIPAGSHDFIQLGVWNAGLSRFRIGGAAGAVDSLNVERFSDRPIECRVLITADGLPPIPAMFLLKGGAYLEAFERRPAEAVRCADAWSPGDGEQGVPQPGRPPAD
jgi:hypothetical protein